MSKSTSGNPLEREPAQSSVEGWLLPEEEFVRRAGWDHLKAYRSAREETLSVTEEAVRVEKEIDERVKALYGV